MKYRMYVVLPCFVVVGDGANDAIYLEIILEIKCAQQ